MTGLEGECRKAFRQNRLFIWGLFIAWFAAAASNSLLWFIPALTCLLGASLAKTKCTRLENRIKKAWGHNAEEYF